jgi:hypothetical protein
MRSRKPVVLLAFLLLVALTAGAITGGPADFKCPICGTKNTFWEYWSYGSYIYQWPSKFQLIFWPYTDPHFLFHCKKCRFTAFSGDFQRPPQDKEKQIRELLRGIQVDDTARLPEPSDPEARTDLNKTPYMKVPMAVRLEIAEKVYGLWGFNDLEWCHFYRVKSYHLQAEEKLAEAETARRKALELSLKIMQEPERAFQRKELLLIAGAMRHYLKDTPGALADFEAAAKLTYENPKLEPEKNKGYDGYLSKLLEEYRTAIKEGRSTDGKTDH